MSELKVYKNGVWEVVADKSEWGKVSGTLTDQTDLKDALDGKVPTTRTIAGKSLSGDVTLEPKDVGMEVVDKWE